MAEEWRFEVWMREHPSVGTWLKDRPKGTKIRYAGLLMRFCEDVGITPEEWQILPRKKARDLAWSWINEFKGEKSASASTALAMFKSFYRNKDGEILPFDSSRGGKHYIHRQAKKASYEIIPDKTQSYQIIDAAGRLRDRTMFLLAFQSGVRENAFWHLNYAHVRDQLYPAPKVPLILKVTPEIDEKLASYGVPFYYTGLQSEAVQVLRQYCDRFHKGSADGTPLFYTKSGQRIEASFIWRKMRRCVENSLGPEKAKGIWPHSFRKAFRKVVRRANIDDEHKEQFMGHKLKGSREAYYDRHDVEELAEVYMEINFTREIVSNNVERLQKKTVQQNHKIRSLEDRITAIENMLRKYMEKGSG